MPRLSAPPACPVCRAASTAPLMHVEGRDYWFCPACLARFLDPRHLPSPEIERAHYRLHENDPADPRYRRFLARLADPLRARLAPASSGLDYGCGPGPALAAMLEEEGHRVALYDPFFHPDEAALGRSYDFVTCSEVFEHFHHPALELDRLDSLLRPGGWLAVMTCFQTDDARFASWHYRRDPTHVVFWRAATFEAVAALRGWQCLIPCKDVALLRKPGPGA